MGLQYSPDTLTSDKQVNSPSAGPVREIPPRTSSSNCHTANTVTSSVTPHAATSRDNVTSKSACLPVLINHGVPAQTLNSQAARDSVSADMVYVERMEDEYAKREGGA